jgi:enterochelin esterase-like enzyme
MARATGNPLIEGECATIIWQGVSAPLVLDDIHNWDDSPQKMNRLGSRLWSFSFALPCDAYLEYAFVHPKTGERITDPLNPRRVWNGVNASNHFFYMPLASPTPLVKPAKGFAHGTVTRHTLPTRDFASGRNRIVYLYRPAVDGPLPLLIVYDGADFLRRARLNVIVDNLVSGRHIRPLAMALVQNGGAARAIEYSCSESTLDLLMECVLPLARKNLDLEPCENGNYGIMGASLGGSMALFTALRLPHVFRKVLSQSGDFISPDYQSVVMDLVRYAPPPDIGIWMDAGKLEWLLEGNRQMVALLKEKKYRVSFHEFSGGHNFTSWRDDLGHGLESLYKKRFSKENTDEN